MYIFLLLALLFLVTIFLTETEYFGFSTMLCVASVVILQVTDTVNVLSFIAHNAGQFLLYVLGYLTIGILWSIVKWFSFLMKFRDLFRQLKKEYLETNNLKEIPEGDVETKFKDFVRMKASYDSNYKYNFTYLNKPRASLNKSRIVGWMSFWPYSLVGTVFNDPIKRLFVFMFNTFKTLYEKISDQVFKNDLELK